MLPRIADIKDSDGADEVEFRSADVDIGAILRKVQSQTFWECRALGAVYAKDSWIGIDIEVF